MTPQISNQMISTLIVKAFGVCISAGVTYIFVCKLRELFDPQHEANKAARKKVEYLRRILKLDPNIELSSYEIRIASQLVIPEEGLDMADVGGYEDLLSELTDNIMVPLKLHAANIQIPSVHYSPPKGILLYGPPGCGKTLIARVIAKEAKAHFVNFDISILNDMYYGETSKLTKALFTLTNKIQPCIIFIDEIDAVLRSRNRIDHETTALMKTQFMTLWDGFLQSSSSVIIVAATNRPEDVDNAILRRLPFRMHIPKPDLLSREGILRVLLKGERKVPDFDYWKVANGTDSMSGSELKEAVRLACLDKYRDVARAAVDSSEELQEHIDRVQIAPEDVIRAAELFQKNSKDLKKMELIADPFNLD